MKEFFALLSLKFGNRGTSRNKSKFLKWYLPQVRKLGYSIDVIAGKGNTARICNVMIGDYRKAKQLLMVPYDTPVCTIYPIIYYPFNIKKNHKNLFRCMMLQLCLSILLALLSLAIVYQSLQLANASDYLCLCFGCILFIASIFLGRGIANRNNFNRNNAALSIFTQILSEKHKDIAYLLMDSASGSLKGFGLLQEYYGSKLEHLDAFLIDCVGIGDCAVVGSSDAASKTRCQSLWYSLQEEHMSIKNLFSSVNIIARGNLISGELEVRHTGNFQDRIVDFDQMDEIVNVLHELMDLS